MNREERLRAVLSWKEPDRVPVSVWMHLSQYDQDPRSLAEAMVEFNEKYDYDFIKMMPFGAYTTSDWGTKLRLPRPPSPAWRTTKGSSLWPPPMAPGAKPFRSPSG